MKYKASPEQVAARNARQAAKVEKSKRTEENELKYFEFPPEVVTKLLKKHYWPAWSVAIAIYQKWYATFQGNPVKLTSKNLKENYDISRGQKERALRILEETGKYVVKRTPRQNPQVTMSWKPIQNPNQY
jgi:hypothetical protein